MSNSTDDAGKNEPREIMGKDGAIITIPEGYCWHAREGYVIGCIDRDVLKRLLALCEEDQEAQRSLMAFFAQNPMDRRAWESAKAAYKADCDDMERILTDLTEGDV